MVLSTMSQWLAAAATIVAMVIAQQTALPLGEVQVAGTKRFTPADILKLSGLKVGQPVAGPEFEAVAKQMAATGLFRRVGYRYASNAGGRWVLTFEIEDLDWNVPVAFDNFIWFSDEELTKGVRESIPSFAGTLPATPEVSSLMTATLQRLLQARSIVGRVEFMAEGTVGSQALKGYLFRIVDPAPPVCLWTFNGAAGIQSKDLEAELTAAGRAYSRTFVTRASKGTLTHLYRKLGYWRAAVGEPSVALSKSAGCDGVSVTMTITEGAQYQ
jgi:outer membrane protein assembly factor BamA